MLVARIARCELIWLIHVPLIPRQRQEKHN